jgi:hypothetical protein
VAVVAKRTGRSAERAEVIVASGHKLTRSQRARRKAEKLADDAKAVRAQSDVQQRRTGRNLGRDA